MGKNVETAAFVDTATEQVTSSGDKVFWMLFVSVPDPKSATAYSLTQFQVSCGTSEIGTRYEVDYGPNGNLVKSSGADSHMDPVIPGSIGDAAAAFVCKGVDPMPGAKPIDDVSVAVAAAQEALRQGAIQSGPLLQVKPAAPKKSKKAVPSQENDSVPPI